MHKLHCFTALAGRGGRQASRTFPCLPLACQCYLHSFMHTGTVGNFDARAEGQGSCAASCPARARREAPLRCSTPTRRTLAALVREHTEASQAVLYGRLKA